MAHAPLAEKPTCGGNPDKFGPPWWIARLGLREPGNGGEVRLTSAAFACFTSIDITVKIT